MKEKNTFSVKQYKKKNPTKANAIVKAVKRAAKQYEQTFRKLATT